MWRWRGLGPPWYEATDEAQRTSEDRHDPLGLTRRVTFDAEHLSDPGAPAVARMARHQRPGRVCRRHAGRRDHAPLSRHADRGAAGAARPPGHGEPARRTRAAARRPRPLVQRRRAQGRHALRRGRQPSARVPARSRSAGLDVRDRRLHAREAAAAAALSEHRARHLHAARRATGRCASACGRCSTRGRTKRRSIIRCPTRRRWSRATDSIEVQFSRRRSRRCGC